MQMVKLKINYSTGDLTIWKSGHAKRQVVRIWGCIEYSLIISMLFRSMFYGLKLKAIHCNKLYVLCSCKFTMDIICIDPDKSIDIGIPY